MTKTKIIAIPLRVSEEEKETIEQALIKAKKDNYLLTRTSLFIWLCKKFLTEGGVR